MAQISEYLAERYPIFDDIDAAAYNYLGYLLCKGYNFLDRPYGFITYKFQGDACIISDIYVNKEFRKTKKAWQLWSDMLKTIQGNDNCHVVIGFSDHIGADPTDGINAMLAADFIKAYDTEERAIYFRGTE